MSSKSGGKGRKIGRHKRKPSSAAYTTTGRRAANKKRKALKEQRRQDRLKARTKARAGAEHERKAELARTKAAKEKRFRREIDELRGTEGAKGRIASVVDHARKKHNIDLTDVLDAKGIRGSHFKDAPEYVQSVAEHVADPNGVLVDDDDDALQRAADELGIDLSGVLSDPHEMTDEQVANLPVIDLNEFEAQA